MSLMTVGITVVKAVMAVATLASVHIKFRQTAYPELRYLTRPFCIRDGDDEKTKAETHSPA